MHILATRLPLFPIWPAMVDLDGIQVPLRELPLEAGVRRRLMRGSYETAERGLIEQYIREGDQVLELGASMGIVSTSLSRKIGRQGRLVCVEANLQLRVPFNRVTSLNGVEADWIHALSCPIWREEVPAEVSGKLFATGNSSLSGHATSAGDKNAVPVPWKTALNICEESGLEPTALVADIEGAEAIWQDFAPNFPQSLRTIIIELHPRRIGSGCSGKVIQAALDEGFRIGGVDQTVFAFVR